MHRDWKSLRWDQQIRKLYWVNKIHSKTNYGVNELALASSQLSLPLGWSSSAYLLWLEDFDRALQGGNTEQQIEFTRAVCRDDTGTGSTDVDCSSTGRWAPTSPERKKRLDWRSFMLKNSLEKDFITRILS